MGFWFQDDFWESVSLQPKSRRGKLIEAIVVYWFTGEEIKMPDSVKSAFISIRARLNRSKINQENGSRKKQKKAVADTFAVSETPSETTRDDQNSLLKREIEIEKLSTNVDNPPKPPTGEVVEIIDYLNAKTGKKFKATSKKTRGLINARFSEGFTLPDFKAVIDNRVAKWETDPKMNEFLRPETLFGTKFEGYLNEKPRGGLDDELSEYASRLS